MFRNSGRKIMGLVKFVFYANAIIIAMAVVGLAIYMLTEGEYAMAFAALLGGAVVGAIYLGLVYLSLLCMYAFGEMVQCNIEQTELLKRMADSPAKDRWPSHPRPAPAHTPAPTPAPAPAPRPAPAPAPDPRPAPAPAPVPKTRSSDADRTAICPHCGARQSPANNFCQYCSTPMRGTK